MPSLLTLHSLFYTISLNLLYHFPKPLLVTTSLHLQSYTHSVRELFSGAKFKQLRYVFHKFKLRFIQNLPILCIVYFE